MSKALLKKKEVARRLAKTTRGVELWMNDGKIPFIRVGAGVWFDWDDIVESLKNQSADTSAVIKNPNVAVAG